MNSSGPLGHHPYVDFASGCCWGRFDRDWLRLGRRGRAFDQHALADAVWVLHCRRQQIAIDL